MFRKILVCLGLLVVSRGEVYAVDENLLITVYQNCVGYHFEENIKQFAKPKADGEKNEAGLARARSVAEEQCKAVYERCAKEPEGMLCKMHVKNYTEVFLPKLPPAIEKDAEENAE